MRFYYNTIPFFCLALALWSLFGFGSAIFLGIMGSLGLLGILVLASNTVAQWYKNRQANLPWLFSVLTILAFLTIGQTTVYLVYAITPITIAFFLFILTIIGSLTKISIKKPQSINPLLKLPVFYSTDIFALGSILSLIGAIFIVFLNRTTEALVSPWQALGPIFFALYGLGVIFTAIYALKSERKIAPIILNLALFFTTYSVAMILYPIGYGYDPFLHRAAENYIYDNGFILPKTPFYIGQYVIVNFLSFITHLPIKLIDIVLLPLLASIFIPLCAQSCFINGFNLKKNIAQLATIFFLIYPTSLFIATTPYSYSALFLALTLLLIPTLKTINKTNIIFLILLSGTALAIHPLAGIFVFFASSIHAISLLTKKPATKFIFWLLIFLASICAPLLFIIYGAIRGSISFEIQPFYSALTQFVSLLTTPYYVNKQAHISLLLSGVYLYEMFIPYIITFFAIIGFILSDKKMKIFLILPITLLINSFLLILFVSIPALSTYEQLQYAQRLLQLIPITLLPLAISLMQNAECKMQNDSNAECKMQNAKYYNNTNSAFCILNFAFKTRFLIFTFAILLIFSLYLVYPQSNARVQSRGYNVTQADIDAVKWIATDAGNTRYVVLSNIITAAASIDQFGFSTYYDAPNGQVFYYSIPSGGLLANTFNDLVYKGQKREYADALMEQLKIDRVYFLMSDYWHNSAEVIPEAKKTADAVNAIGGGKVMVFTYNSKMR